ncbi:uncharacterized protein LOC135134476 [Zophobas morio]
MMMILVGAMAEDLFEEKVYKDAVWFVKECGAKSLTLCLKEKALKFIERLPNNIDIGNGIRIKQSDSDRVSREYSSVRLPDETKEREAVIDRVLVERIFDYLRSHTLELKIPMIIQAVNEESENSLVEAARKEGGGGLGGYGGGGGKKGKGGKKGGMGAMMMMFYMKSAMMYAIGLKAIGAIAFKALIVAKVALTIATIVALKKIVDSKGSTSTYEVIAHSAHDHDHGHDRVYTPADLVYRGYRNGV